MSISLWSESGSVKILADKKYEAKKSKDIIIEGAQGEFESAQLLITPDSNVISYTVAAKDLKDESGNIFSKNNFTIYNQKYINVKEPSPHEPHQLAGFYPDALLPFEKAVEYRENKIEAGKNQGIWLTAEIPYGQAAGIYSGEFILIIDGILHEIPVSVTVWDFEISKEVNFQSDFVVGSDGLLHGEYDYSQHMYRKYVEKLIDFRLSPHRIIQYLNVPFVEPQDFIDELRYLTAEGKRDLSTVMIPVFPADSGINEPHFEGIVLAVAEACIEDKKDYLKKAAVYCGFIDEPHLNETWDKTNLVCRVFEDAKNRIAAKFLSTGEPTQQRRELAEEIRKIPNYVTTYFDEKLTEIKNYCPHISSLRKKELRDKYAEVSKPLWSYTCGVSDVPTYGIDSPLADTRLVGWMAADYNFIGFLYWDTVVYTKGVWNQPLHVNQKMVIDPYEEPVRCAKDNGDGFIFYPGRPYGIYGPVESIRLHAIRDCAEEYEYLIYYKELCAKANIDPDKFLRPMFDSLFVDSVVVGSAEDYMKARKSLALEIVKLKKKLEN